MRFRSFTEELRPKSRQSAPVAVDWRFRGIRMQPYQRTDARRNEDRDRLAREIRAQAPTDATTEQPRPEVDRRRPAPRGHGGAIECVPDERLQVTCGLGPLHRNAPQEKARVGENYQPSDL